MAKGPDQISRARIAAATRSSAGFSLVEVLVVLAIVAMAASIVMLTAPPSGMSLANEADRLATRLSDARDLALIENRAVLVEVTETGYDRKVRTRMGWIPVDNRDEFTPWLGGTSIATDSGALPAAVLFDTIGLTAPVEFSLYRDGREETVVIDSSGNIRRGGPR